MKRMVMALALALSSSTGFSQEASETDAEAPAFPYKQCLNGTLPGEAQRDVSEPTSEAARKARQDSCRAICEAWDRGLTEEEKQAFQLLTDRIRRAGEAHKMRGPKDAHPYHQ
jgi:hypothetical protein